MDREQARKKLLVLAFVVGVCIGAYKLAYMVIEDPDSGMAVLAGCVPVAISVWIILRSKTDSSYLLRIFAAALILRWLLAFWINSRNLQGFFGGDAISYDFFGNALCDAWRGIGDPNARWLLAQIDWHRSGWGMPYYVASIYYIIGRNPLALQLINAALGAATCVVVYKIAENISSEIRIARVASFLTAISPSMILWSAQGLKDAPIVFCLCLCMLFALQLRGGVKVRSVFLLVLFFVCLYSLRHYAAYIVFVATAGSLLFAAKKFTPARIVQGGILIIVIGVALSYFGAADVAQNALDLKRLQEARVWSASVSNSGFGSDVDITDPTAALSFLPLGVVYVLFAPFPWMITNLRQLITLPELVVWWALVPMLVRGYWFSLRHRLRETFAICIFTIALTLAYALFQSNVGTAYRHRAQLFGFFFIFIAIGLENRRAAKAKRRAEMEAARYPFAPGTMPVRVSLSSRPVTQRIP